jgi:hypothetical protein
MTSIFRHRGSKPFDFWISIEPPKKTSWVADLIRLSQGSPRLIGLIFLINYPTFSHNAAAQRLTQMCILRLIAFLIDERKAILAL